MVKKIETGGRRIDFKERPQKQDAQLPTGNVLFQPDGSTNLVSKSITITPGEIAIVSLYGLGAEHAALTIRAYKQSTNMGLMPGQTGQLENDYARYNGSIPMVMTQEWVVSINNPVLLMSIPGDYFFLIESDDPLARDLLRLEYTMYKASSLAHTLPPQYFI